LPPIDDLRHLPQVVRIWSVCLDHNDIEMVNRETYWACHGITILTVAAQVRLKASAEAVCRQAAG